MARVKIELVCAECGNTFTHIKFCRNTTEALGYEEWAKKNITQCPDCFKREQRAMEDAKERKAIESASVTLVGLEGTEKQVAWATKIRQEAVAKCIQYKPGKEFWDMVNARTEAKWWIDARNDIEYPQALARKLRKAGKETG